MDYGFLNYIAMVFYYLGAFMLGYSTEWFLLGFRVPKRVRHSPWILWAIGISMVISFHTIYFTQTGSSIIASLSTVSLGWWGWVGFITVLLLLTAFLFWTIHGITKLGAGVARHLISKGYRYDKECD